MSASPTISVIIPTLNEADELSATLRHAQAIDGLHEIIVVDAGSTDSTRDLARAAGCHVIHSQPNRGLQQRLGAQHASGDIILFLHADTWLPHDAGKTIRQTLAKPNVIAGAFQKRFRDRGALPGSRIRCWLLWKWFNKFFGDQAIFVKRHALEHAGGMPSIERWRHTTKATAVLSALSRCRTSSPRHRCHRIASRRGLQSRIL